MPLSNEEFTESYAERYNTPRVYEPELAPENSPVFTGIPTPPPDPVKHPQHYTYGEIECIDYIRSMGIASEFSLGNVIKYVHRYQSTKNPQDLMKAKWYLNYVINLETIK